MGSGRGGPKHRWAGNLARKSTEKEVLEFPGLSSLETDTHLTSLVRRGMDSSVIDKWPVTPYLPNLAVACTLEGSLKWGDSFLDIWLLTPQLWHYINSHCDHQNQTTFCLEHINMSNQNSSSYTSYSSVSYSSSSNVNGEQVSGSRHVQTSHTNPSGTTVSTASQNLGEPVIREQRQFDSQGREMIGGPQGATASRRIEDVDEEQARRDREYEERIEEEYAKREGGA